MWKQPHPAKPQLRDRPALLQLGFQRRPLGSKVQSRGPADPALSPLCPCVPGWIHSCALIIIWTQCLSSPEASASRDTPATPAVPCWVRLQLQQCHRLCAGLSPRTGLPQGLYSSTQMQRGGGAGSSRTKLDEPHAPSPAGAARDGCSHQANLRPSVTTPACGSVSGMSLHRDTAHTNGLGTGSMSRPTPGPPCPSPAEHQACRTDVTPSQRPGEPPHRAEDHR